MGRLFAHWSIHFFPSKAIISNWFNRFLWINISPVVVGSVIFLRFLRLLCSKSMFLHEAEPKSNWVSCFGPDYLQIHYRKNVKYCRSLNCHRKRSISNNCCRLKFCVSVHDHRGEKNRDSCLKEIIQFIRVLV